MLTIKKGVLNITEQTVRELMTAIEKARAESVFTEEPMPDGDMEQSTYYRLQRARGKILVTSEFAPLDFFIALEVRPHSQESLGYKLLANQSVHTDRRPRG